MTDRVLKFGLALAVILCAMDSRADDSAKQNQSDLVPLKLKLPDPVFAGTPKDPPKGIDLEPMPTNLPPPLMVPADVRNIAPGKKITSGGKATSPSELAKLTDGNKEVSEDSIAILPKGLQWVQFDLSSPQELFAIVIWHAHDTAKVYRSVIVQVADDADFTTDVRTLFNNDRDNSAGLGAGADKQYFESYMGKIIKANGARARFVRLYSHGSTDSQLNEYTEVEIYGRPAK